VADHDHADHEHEVTYDGQGAADRRWLAATWPFVRAHLPPPPCRVIDLGCGPLGGFVPALLRDGYDAKGIDPEAPVGPRYQQVHFEEYRATKRVAAIVASTSLHHVGDLNTILTLAEHQLEPGGVLVVAEWARERFDEATARWCFERLADDEAGWLHRRRDEWIASEKSWDVFVDDWARSEGMHTGQVILDALNLRFDTELVVDGPYFFGDLSGVSYADEQAAINAGRIQPNGIRYVGRATPRR
jgi:SAM-dependent methyltransferase